MLNQLPDDLIEDITRYLTALDIHTLAKTCLKLYHTVCERVKLENIFKHECITEMLSHQDFSIYMFELDMCVSEFGKLDDKRKNKYEILCQNILMSKIKEVKEQDKRSKIIQLDLMWQGLPLSASNSQLVGNWVSYNFELFVQFITSDRFRHGAHSPQIAWLHTLINDAELEAIRQIVFKFPVTEIKTKCKEYIFIPIQDESLVVE